MKSSLTALGFLTALLPLAVSAQRPCALINGCSASNPVFVFLGPIVSLFAYTAAGLTVLFIVWGGMQMMFSFGAEDRFSNGKNSVIWALVGMIVVLVSQILVSYVSVRASSATAGNAIITIIDGAIGILLSVFYVGFAIVVIVAGVQMVLDRGKSEQFETARKALIYAVAGAIVIHLAKAITWALVNLNF